MGHATRCGIAAAVLSTFFYSTAAHAGLIGTASTSDLTLGGAAADLFQYASGVNPQKGKTGNSSGFAGAFAGASSTTGWDLLSKFTSADGNGSMASGVLGAASLSLLFNKTDSRHGSWSVTNNSATQDVTLDLVFAMHAGNGSGAWLFDDQRIGAGATVSGTWDLNIFNDGKQYADYSNLTLFSRNGAWTAAQAPAKASEDKSSQPQGHAAKDGAPDVTPFAAPSEAGGAFQGGGTSLPLPSGGDTTSGTVPEPGSLGTMAAGLALLGLVLRRRAAARA